MSRYNDKNGGIGIHIYPNWHYNERVTLGVNIEPTLVARDDIIDDTQFLGVLSLSPTANYHFTNSKIKPFAGLGVGLYSVVIRHYSSFNVGVRPIIGISFSNFFDFSIEYNKILSSTSLGSFDNYYLAIKGSFSIGIFTSKRKRNMQQTSKVLENQYKRQI